jgi:3-hydroxyisobutyrate dehydrogenase-like beta-hydroxyacid dehydrogenase
MSEEIGFVGIGHMGLPMAGRLLDAGHRLVLRDLDEAVLAPLLARQAQPAASAREVADRTAIVFASLPSNAAIREVVLGADGLVHGAAIRTYVSTCTTGSPFAIEIAAALAEKGIATVEAPISGGPPGAVAGTLSVMVSGPQAAYEAVEPMLRAFGKTVVYCGEAAGLAQVLKLANNILSATALAASAEAMAMGVKAGLDPKLMLEAINAGSGRNSATQDKIPRDVLTGNFAYGAEMHILAKDIDLALAEGEALGVPQLVCQQVRQVFKLAMHQGWQNRDITEIVKLVEGWSGVEIRAKG